MRLRRKLAVEAYRGELAHLREGKERMQARIGARDAALLVRTHERDEAREEYRLLLVEWRAAVAELQRIRGELGYLAAAVDRAMPDPPAEVA